MKKAKLALDLLEQEMELLSNSESKMFVGGDGPYNNWLMSVLNSMYGVDTSGFSISAPGSNGLSTLNFNNGSFQVQFGMQGSNATATFNVADFELSFGVSVNGYQTPPDNSSAVYGPSPNAPYSFSISYTLPWQ